MPPRTGTFGHLDTEELREMARRRKLRCDGDRQQLLTELRTNKVDEIMQPFGTHSRKRPTLSADGTQARGDLDSLLPGVNWKS